MAGPQRTQQIIIRQQRTDRGDGPSFSTVCHPFWKLSHPVFLRHFEYAYSEAVPDMARISFTWRKAVVFLLAGALLFLLHRLTHTVCLLYAVTGLPCPACGSTRAAIWLLRGDLISSLWFHPLAVLLPILGILWLRIRWFSASTPRWWNRLLFVVLALYIAVYAARMILLFPHTEPMVWNPDALLPRVRDWLKAIFVKK